MEDKKIKGNPYAAFKKLTIANTAIAWVEFAYIVVVAALAIELWASYPPTTQFFVNKGYNYIYYFGTVLMAANIALAIAQSIKAKKLGKIAINIGYEQVICILIMLIGFAFILGDAGVYCASLLPVNGQPIPEWLQPDVSLNEHWLVYIAAITFACSALFTAGFASYNSVLCAKVKVYKTKKA